MLDGLVDLVDKLGILAALKEKLFKNRKVDAQKFASELNEITSIIQAVDRITARFLTLSFRSDEKGNLTEARKFLIELEGGGTSMQAPTVRAHCERLRSIYQRDLDPYFTRTLSLDELEKVRQAFASLEDFHSNTLPEVNNLLEWLADAARAALNKVDADALEDAEEVIREARLQILPQRRAITRAVKVISELQGDLVQVSGTQ